MNDRDDDDLHRDQDLDHGDRDRGETISAVTVEPAEPMPVGVPLRAKWKPGEIPVEPERRMYWAGCTSDAPVAITIGGVEFPKTRGGFRRVEDGDAHVVERIGQGTFVRLTDHHVRRVLEHAARKVVRCERPKTADAAEKPRQKTGVVPIGCFAYLVPVDRMKIPEQFDHQLPPTLIALPSDTISNLAPSSPLITGTNRTAEEELVDRVAVAGG